jgi:hypothetical protein
MNEVSDIIDIAEEALRNAQKVCTGANVHNVREAMASVEFWLMKVSGGQLHIEDINCVDELLKAINRCHGKVVKL